MKCAEAKLATRKPSSAKKPADSTCIQACGEEAKLYRLMLIDEITGSPQRLASHSEAVHVAQTLYKDSANSCLPCLKTSQSSTDEEQLEVDFSVPIGQLSKIGGPCHHCGATSVGLRFNTVFSNFCL